MKIDKYLDLLGLIVKDKVTGFEGIAESLSFDLYGCIQIDIRPHTLDKDGKVQDGRWFDVNRLTIMSPDPIIQRPDFSHVRMLEYDHGPADKPSKSY